MNDTAPEQTKMRNTPTPVISEDADGFRVTFDWSSVADVDRPNGYSISTGSGRLGQRYADRVAAATRAGVAFDPNPEIKTDVNGKTYIAAGIRIFGRHLNADLIRPGF